MRLDALLTSEKIFPSRTKATQAVLEGRVLYNGKTTKPSIQLDTLESVTILSNEQTFVSNGGYKLQKALSDFSFDVTNMTAVDIGASNGGFTDCLLKSGVKKVFAVDVGESQLDNSLKNDKRIIVLDKTNARFLNSETIGEQVDLVTADVSFISLTYILDGVKSVLKDKGVALLLIKPQFECGKEYLGNSGIVKSASARKSAVKKVYLACVDKGLYPVNFTTAPIREKKNIEYVIMLKNNDKNGLFSLNDIII